MNISGVLVQCRPEWTESIIGALKELAGCTYHLHDPQGRIIVTLEGEGVSEEIAILKRIRKIDHVIAADVVYAYSEEELEKERHQLDLSGDVPAWLNDDSVRAEDIRYHGDLRKKI